jgi:hypothetical protein
VTDRLRPDLRLGSFADVAASAHVLTLEPIRAAVAESHPDASEVAGARERSVWWGWGPRKMTDGYAYPTPHRSHVNLGFFRGAALPDPESLLGGMGEALRYVKLKRPGDVRRPAVLALLAAARDERGRALTLA